ncbi:MAG TPA: hypothetical protein VK879_15085 [Candidatus Sulfomarinibacteraceae bacterium]|nr:hypothetical protein [Candidatus Sulfomarinibacteraceae bacterium]
MADSSQPNTICLYYDDGAYQPEIDAIGNLSSGSYGDSYVQDTAAAGGALASHFFAACGTPTTTDAGAISITAGAMTPASDGFRLYSIEYASQCSPSDNTDCWDYQNISCTTASCILTDPTPNDGHFVVGHEMSPTSIILASLATTAAPGANASLLTLLLVAGLLLSVGSVVALARRQRYRRNTGSHSVSHKCAGINSPCACISSSSIARARWGMAGSEGEW